MRKPRFLRSLHRAIYFICAAMSVPRSPSSRRVDAGRGSTTFYASGNVLTTEAGRATYDEYDLGTTVGSWFTLEMFQWFVYNKAVECYGMGRPLPSIDAIGWEGVFTTPCANFPVVAGLP